MSPQVLLFEQNFQKAARASRYLERVCNAYPELIAELRNSSNLPLNADAMRQKLPAVDTPEALDANLRRLRRDMMVRTIFRDINGLADFAEVVDAVSNLADVTLAAANSFHTMEVAKRFGMDYSGSTLNELLIVGMGKLGGGELNVSSDIDLIFVHDEDGDATPHRSWHEFHSELGKRIIRSIDNVDANGFVFRVDMRLRPFGASGPLVSSLASLENYFITQARAWERYAWLKGRAITGAPSTIRALENLVRPFVYRRYHDYAAIEEMRDLHGQIRADAGKRNRLDDIKVGVGGIREIEFIAQLFQLIRGGRETALQTRSTRAALRLLAANGTFTADRVDELQRAYLFLRNLEHRLQYLDDQQTQLLPSGEEDRQRIAEAMNFPEWTALLKELCVHRDIVTREFEALFAQPASRSSDGHATATSGSPGSDSIHQRIQSIVVETVPDEGSAKEVVRRVDAWLSASRTQTLSSRSRSRMEALIPMALQAALKEGAASAVATRTFFRLFDLIEAVDKRETYLALLVEYPQVLERVARIAARSAWAADFLRRHPILLDELIAPPPAHASLDWLAERQSLRAACDSVHGDIERQYEILRHAKQVATLKLNIADIEGRLGVMALSDELSHLADMLVDTAMILAWRGLNPSLAAGNWQAPPGFAVVGYGKLGSKELGYASDLDIVFICDPALAPDGERYGKLGQRLNSWLNTMTSGGILYETDLRLRPDGDSGLLVTTLDAFREYQHARAWNWEHQALTRARFCAGDVRMAAPFEAIRSEILGQSRDMAKLKAEIIAMREKMRAEKKDRGDQLDLKHTRGGMVDVEFIVQYLILAYSHQHAEFLGNLGNFALLTRAAALGIIDETLAAQVAKAYLTYRERQHFARNNNEQKTWIGTDELIEERRAVTSVWQALLG